MRAMHSELIGTQRLENVTETLAVPGHALLRAKIYKKGDRSQSHNSDSKASFTSTARADIVILVHDTFSKQNVMNVYIQENTKKSLFLKTPRYS